MIRNVVLGRLDPNASEEVRFGLDAGLLGLAAMRPAGLVAAARGIDCDVLIAEGVPSWRIATRGMGFNQPVASNDTEAGRAQNRRVEILIRPTR